MSAEHCPDCDAVGADCACAPGARFDPMRVRPYVTLPDPGEPEGTAPPPITGAVSPAPQDDTPAYGIPVPSAHHPWPEGPAAVPRPDETTRLRAVPQAGGTGPRQQGRPAGRRLLPLLIGAAAAVALGGTAVAVWVMPGSDGGDAAVLDAKASAPVLKVAPAEPSRTPSLSSPSASRSASASRSPSPSASKSASPTPSPSASRTSAPPSPSPSPTASRTTGSPPAAQGPTLRYGDSGAEVEKLQRLLAGRGLYRGRVDGKYDWKVENAVSTFQYNNNIDDEWGVYGPVTRRALEG
ncbi:peptidoglycan-binding domain-containing protein [Streptomyces sp. CB00455]|uniref:peptidoglycan-binding domain-containing protein n=1 Tax=Streptomyces sp. CB00455 TaxID=1703927 RepID=UPI000AFCF3FE|nr:peptidoglycan-binding domain-containing protein [Streptomyces sp. CB00455]